MKAEFTAIIEKDPDGGYWAICPEIPGANGQGETIEEAKDSLRDAIELILEDRRKTQNCRVLSKERGRLAFSLDKPEAWCYRGNPAT